MEGENMDEDSGGVSHLKTVMASMKLQNLTGYDVPSAEGFCQVRQAPTLQGWPPERDPSSRMSEAEIQRVLDSSTVPLAVPQATVHALSLGRGIRDDNGAVWPLVLLHKGLDAQARPSINVVNL